MPSQSMFAVQKAASVYWQVCSEANCCLAVTGAFGACSVNQSGEKTKCDDSYAILRVAVYRGGWQLVSALFLVERQQQAALLTRSVMPSNMQFCCAQRRDYVDSGVAEPKCSLLMH